MNIDFLIEMEVSRFTLSRPKKWTRREDTILKKNIGILTYDEIGKKIGRSGNAVKIRKFRTGIPCASKRTGWLTGQDVSRYLGVDSHTVIRWLESGRIISYVLPGKRRINTFRKIAIYRFAIKPENWMCFRTEKIRDKHLQKLVIKAQSRWDDEWIRIGEAAKQLGADHANLNNLVNSGQIPGAIKYGNWYFMKSSIDALEVIQDKSGRNFIVNKNKEKISGAERWILHARNELGMTYEEIAVRMKNGWNKKTVRYRFQKLMNNQEEK